MQNRQEDPAKQDIIDALTSRVDQQLESNQAKMANIFITQLYNTLALEDLLSCHLDDLYGAALSQWNYSYQRKSDECKIRVFNPTLEHDGWRSKHTVVQISMADMPFLVDSLRMEINRHNLHVHFIVHFGGMRVVRDAAGKIISVLTLTEAPEQETEFEAPIFMQIDRQADSAVLLELQQSLESVLADVRACVSDWQPMRERVSAALQELEAAAKYLSSEELAESKDFLTWIINDHFTFLGCRDYALCQLQGEQVLQVVEGTGLGVLRHCRNSTARRIASLTQEAQKLIFSPQILIISKTNTRATVHRPVYTDYIGVKRFNDSGEVIGELRIIGLYTSVSYNSNPLYIPFLRRKVAAIMDASGLPRKGHAAKTLLNILETLPRDDLFQAPVEELFPIAMGILNIRERQCVRLFARKDVYGRFMSCLVYVPRERVNTELRKKYEAILLQAFNGKEIEFTTHFSDSILARIHFLVRIQLDKPLGYDLKVIEARLLEASRLWVDDLKELLIEHHGEENGNRLFNKYGEAFRSSYREDFSATSGLLDISHIEKLSDSNVLEMRFFHAASQADNYYEFKLFHAENTLPLSDVVPILENMGLRIISERPYKVTRSKGQLVWINDFTVVHSDQGEFELTEIKDIFQESFLRVWLGEMENDGFNRLVLGAKLNWREISMLRAYTKHLRQVGFTFSQTYIEETLARNPEIVKLLVQLFKLRLDPSLTNNDADIEAVRMQIIEELESVAILDEDRILRRLLEVIYATLRTNYFQVDSRGKEKVYISFKFDSSAIPEMPLPLPLFEIFVCSPRFEGIHLRSAKVARGGLRWSDRREDFRTEVLGLMKAQVVKNSVIVPSGAKGGFVAKCLPEEGGRDVIMAEVVECYSNFVRGLLDLTDNFVNGEIVHPRNVRRYDEADPYLVVAADKGTATFSDIANGISREYDFWLGDAFASGGTAGYDHKKMSITARGAWVSVERHFRELGLNTQTTDFTVVGIGDMAGDVFGNGMLLSPHIKLVAAFNHMHIFVDPQPNPQASLQERRRLFHLPRSTWADYDSALISEGGGVFSRSSKSIKLTKQMKELVQLDKDTVTPNELIKAILQAPVDLLWNGGIGTYVKASHETNDMVGDRSNDVLRINGDMLRCRVVAEGGNLGFTQLGRVEYALKGGKINTDFIDNSAGVDCSDHEVNIKILFNQLIADGKMTLEQRNQCLAEMTDDVANLVLHDNYMQTLALSIADSRALSYLELFTRYIQLQEANGKLDRGLEFLPTEKELLARKNDGKSLTRPEVAVLLAYSKSILKAEILDSTLPEDSYLCQVILLAFPYALRKKYSDEISEHRLRREIIATQLSNILVNEVGINFVVRLNDECGAPPAVIVRAYSVIRQLFDFPTLWRAIQELDYQISAAVQYEILIETIRLARRATRWLLRNHRAHFDIQTILTQLSPGLTILNNSIHQLALGCDKQEYLDGKEYYLSHGVPAALAEQIAKMRLMFSALDIVRAANDYQINLLDVGNMYFALSNKLEVGWLRNEIISQHIEDRWDALIRESLRDDLDWQQRALTIAVLKNYVAEKDNETRLRAWFEQHHGLIERWQTTLSELRSHTAPDFTIYAVAVREMFDLAQTSQHFAESAAN